jgi:hypothetical protein
MEYTHHSERTLCAHVTFLYIKQISLSTPNLSHNLTKCNNSIWNICVLSV